MRRLTTTGRVLLAVAVLVPSAVVAVLHGTAGPASAEADIGAEIVLLRDETSRLVHQQRDSPLPMEDHRAAMLEQGLKDAEGQVGGELCLAAGSLLDYAREVREEVALIRREIDAGTWEGDDLQRMASIAGQWEAFDLRGRALRGDALTRAEACEGPLDIYVDPDRAKPAGEAIHGFEPGVDRPLAGLRDADGTQADFVANELLVSTSDSAALEAFLQQWNGTVLEKVELDGGDAHYLVRIDTGLADPQQLVDDLLTINEEHRQAGSLAVSSRDGLAVLSAAAAAATAPDSPLTVGVNWLGKSFGFDDGVMREAAMGPDGVTGGAYNRNAYTWQYLKAGGPQDIGVTAAWTLLDSVGRLGNQVPIAILDGGFAPSVDMPSSTVTMSSIPLVDPSYDYPWNTPFHGTMVASVAAAVPGNFAGTAGTAATVAKPIQIWTTADMFGSMVAINLALHKGAKIINMSFGVPVPWQLAFTVLPFDAYTWFVRSTNDVLLVAASGNDGKDVDATTGLWGIRWEKTWNTPCENAGVICVGGLGEGSINRDPESDFGREDVDIFAPFRMLVGPTPNHPDAGTARKEKGTSLSSPYVAGVAALVWAANPSLSADAVEDILLRTMRTSPDNKVKRKVIHALGAVQDALPATLAIQTPVDGAVVSPFQPTQFTANLFSDGHGTATITWRRNGTVIGSGPSIQATLPNGNYTITATATFPDGAVAADTVAISSVDHVPTVQITGPTIPNSVPPVFDQSELIPFHAISLDDFGPLPDSQVGWYLDSSTTPFATGHNVTVNTGAAVGDHWIWFRACDAAGQCGAQRIPIRIQPDGANKPPTAKIANPANGSHLWVNGNDADGFYHELTLAGTVSDPEGAPVTVQWYDNGTPVASTLNPTVKLRAACGDNPHTLVLKATDNAGITRWDTVTVTVALLC